MPLRVRAVIGHMVVGERLQENSLLVYFTPDAPGSLNLRLSVSLYPQFTLVSAASSI